MSAVKHNIADLIWKSPGGKIEILSAQVREAISDLYVIQAEIKSEDAGLNFSDMLNAEAELALKCGPDLSEDKVFSGIITRFSQKRTRHGNLPNASGMNYLYDVEIRPKLWITSKQYRSKIFQQKTAQDIVTEVLDEHGITHQWNLQGTPAMREYCVQYEESDYHFISRLLEDEGICFFFNQKEKKVIFSDHPGGHPDCTPVAEAKYVEEISPRFQFGKQEFIRDFTYEESLGTGRVALNHYNYETSQTNIMAETQEGQLPCITEVERYEHSLNYKDKGEGGAYARFRKEEQFSAAKTGKGSATCRSFEAGFAITMTDHFREELNVKWLLTSCNFELEQGRSRCRFAALPAEVPFRPPRRTPRPKVFGLQTAVVTGPSGSKVYLDQLGRCKLQFHWDREGAKDDRASMWVRVSNNYAGKDYGIQWIPRVGHEVVVTFINGNPDLPLVTGRVYNDFNTAPLGPAKKWQNMIKTIKDNHIIFDDEDGKELVDVRSQKDMTTLVVNDDSQNIGNNRDITVGVDHTESIGSNMSLTVGADRTQTIGANHTETIGSNMTVNIGSNLTETIGANYAETVTAAMALTVGAALNETIGVSHTKQVGASDSITVGGSRSVNVGSSLSESAGGSYSLTAGSNGSMTFGKNGTISTGDNLSIDCGKKAIFNVKDQLTIKCGKASITMKKNGDILIKGKKIDIKASSDIKMKGKKILEN